MLVFQGTVAHATNDDALEVMQDCLLGVQDKKIAFILHGESVDKAAERYDFDLASVHILKPGEFLMPGFIDSHIHAPQFPNSGLGLDLPLLPWLEKYTFPEETKYKDEDYAKDVYKRVVSRTLKNGTTTACYFASIHLEASIHLSDIVGTLGQRAYIGKVNMDWNSPDYYIEDTDTSIRDTYKFVKAVLEKKNPLVTPIVTPRYPPSTSGALMRALSEIVKEYNIPIQSHICETRPSIQWAKELFPDQATYADIFREHGLLNNKTVLAHGIYLTDEELGILKKYGAGISHCPNSNFRPTIDDRYVDLQIHNETAYFYHFSLCSGLLDTRNALDKGVNVGLGTDVSGGYSPSILDALRLAVHTSSVKAIEKGNGYRRLDYKDAFRLATLGGAKVLGLDDVTGNFEVGKDFDALLIDANIRNSPFDVFKDDGANEIIQKFLHLGDDRNISEVYVAGKRVCPS